MNDKLLDNLKGLRNIQPDSEYAKRSLNLILSSKINTATKKETNYPSNKKYSNILAGFFHIPRFAITTATIAVVVLVIFSIFSYLPGNKTQYIVEANEINASIQIKLGEVEYFLNNNKTIDSSKAQSLSQSLEEVASDLNQAKDLSGDPEKIEEALKKIKSAQEALVQINSLLQTQ